MINRSGDLSRGGRALSGHSTRPARQHATPAPARDQASEPDGAYAGAFWTAFRHSINAMFLAGLDRRIVAVNDAGVALAGRSADVLAGERMTLLLDDPAEAPDD